MKKLKVNKQKLDNLISLASISFFVGLVEPKDRKIIIQNESKIRKDFQIKNLLDYESITEASWIKELTEIFPNETEKVSNISKKIFDTIQEFIPIIREYL
ncbi:MAG: hypothetical protein WAU65_02700 [Candidatus Nanoarchaeia archaeon]